ncbi:uncharacterized protein [Physcomitrium patens]|uniref:Methyltransferase domain-containing protein n=1 Tax=Physcomitrium patens TaxID=3218 RepID=A0A2K1JDU6_PHYPA|nr:uncharacterized protein LOC112291987 [Physcomitrium patens]PNR39701.1 hypothetical protein PHYPA_019980 [Physcomitrium patens]|eukprot:XP_024395799.1 uncharacterized protein LOC112291987 [Physcomitrella patens]
MADAEAFTSCSKRVLIYPQKSEFVSPYLREKYEKEAGKNWDLFYKRNADRFFKDRHYLDKEWGEYIRGTIDKNEHCDCKRVILEVGCGTGNTVFPLIAEYPNIFVHACDFSNRAVSLVKAHPEYEGGRVNAFVCDAVSEDLSASIQPASVDVVTMVFMLSAVSPEKMPGVLQNIKRVLKPGGYVLFRDYAVGDLAQKRLTEKVQKISENFFARSDGTRAYYFSEDELVSLFEKEGILCKSVTVHCRQVENRSRSLVMNRRWIQGEFFLPVDGEKKTQTSCADSMEDMQQAAKVTTMVQESVDVDLSEGVASLFMAIPTVEVTKIKVGNRLLLIKCVARENQHTTRATGLLLWDAAPALASVLEANPALYDNKRVLELGCGATALSSLIVSNSAATVFATDGDPASMSLLQENMELNSSSFPVGKVCCRKLEWGQKEDVEAIKSECQRAGFDLIVGTDVTYVAAAVPLLFQTASSLIAKQSSSLFVLCHFSRKVQEADILAAASACGFSYFDVWKSTSPQLVVPDSLQELASSNGPLRLLCFRISEQ